MITWSLVFYFILHEFIYFFANNLQLMASSCLMFRSNLPDAVFSAMETIMTMVLDESEEIPLDILKALLSSVRKENQDQVILFVFTSCFVLFCYVPFLFSYHSVLFI